MGLAVVTGSAGLIGSEAVRLFADKGLDVVGVDNDMRQTFFGAGASTAANRRRLEADVGRYRHVDADIRDEAAISASCYAWPPARPSASGRCAGRAAPKRRRVWTHKR